MECWKENVIIWLEMIVLHGGLYVGCGDADAMVTGGTRHHAATVEKLTKVVEARPGEIIFGLTLMVSRGRTVFIADTNVHDNPTAEQLVQIAISSTRVAKLLVLIQKLLFFLTQHLENLQLKEQSM